jgi:hypothetical protein
MIIAYRKLNEIIRIGEDKIKLFHSARNGVESYKRVIKAIINKNVYQQCVDELMAVHEELNDFKLKLDRFHINNKSSFDGIMRKYLDSYMEYIDAAVKASEKRLILQQLILAIKVNKTMKQYKRVIPDMVEDIDKSYEHCRLKAVAFNRIADKIHNTLPK